MNAYEARKLKKQKVRRENYLFRKGVKLHEMALVEKFYISAFTALNGQPPMVIPALPAKKLEACADRLFARLHELELQTMEDNDV